MERKINLKVYLATEEPTGKRRKEKELKRKKRGEGKERKSTGKGSRTLAALLGQLLTTSHNSKNSLGNQATVDFMKTKEGLTAIITVDLMVALHHRLEAMALRINTKMPATLLG